jgi:hypothetical protein
MTIMKKFFSIITITAAIAVVMASCKSNPGTTQVIFADTTGLAQFQSWKAMNEAQPTYAVNNKAVKRTSSSTKNSSMNSSTTNEAKVVKKKGWSKAAKYAAIGGGTGIIGGAVINKRNRVAGGAIGGAVLGGLGYIIGRSQDKKDGRY